MDHFSKFPICATLQGETADEVARIFMEKVVLDHTMPRQVLTDRGANFLSDLFERVAKSTVRKSHSKTTFYLKNILFSNEHYRSF